MAMTTAGTKEHQSVLPLAVVRVDRWAVRKERPRVELKVESTVDARVLRLVGTTVEMTGQRRAEKTAANLAKLLAAQTADRMEPSKETTSVGCWAQLQENETVGMWVGIWVGTKAGKRVASKGRQPAAKKAATKAVVMAVESVNEMAEQMGGQ